LRGYLGGNLEVINSRGLDKIRRLQPDLVILKIGSNDLCKQKNSVMDVARGIIEFVLKLRYSYVVHKVAVLQILHRLPPTKEIRYEVDTVWFDKRCHGRRPGLNKVKQRG
jgi:lysophospholipase L1-like esterase